MGRVEIIKLVHGWGTVPADGSNKSILIHTSLIGALHTRAERNEGLTPPFDYWLIDGTSVAEPHAQGRIIGTISDVPTDGKKLLRMSKLSYGHLTDPDTPNNPMSFTR